MNAENRMLEIEAMVPDMTDAEREYVVATLSADPHATIVLRCTLTPNDPTPPQYLAPEISPAAAGEAKETT